MPHREMQQEATPNRGSENTWEALGRLVKTMALDAVAMRLSQMDQMASDLPFRKNEGHGDRHVGGHR